MREKPIAALVEPVVDASKDAVDLCAPVIGELSLHVRNGQPVGEGQTLATIRQLHRHYDVVVPASQRGVVTTTYGRSLRRSVAYGEPFARVESSVHVADGPAKDTEGRDGLPAGALVFEAPMDGQLYTRPAPDAPDFVSVDDVVEPGTQVALVEVMKFFQPLMYEGTSPMRIQEIRVTNATSVAAGDPLMVLVPIV